MLVNLIACWAYLQLVVWVSDKFSAKKKTSDDKSGNPDDNDRSQQMGMQPIVDDDAESPTKRPTPTNTSKHQQQQEENNKNDNEEDKGEDIRDFLNRSYKVRF